ncbi:MAG: YceI family protein [Bacteroidota bacterium]
MDALVTPTLNAQAWKLDTNHTIIGFKISHLGIAEITGSFREYEGSMKLQSDDLAGAEIYLKIDTNSIETGNTMRDNHLKTAEFLDTAVFPDITFASTGFEPQGDGKYKLSGNLTIKGVTKNTELQAHYKGNAKDMWGNEVVVFQVEGSIDRTEFGVEWYQLVENTIPVISKEITFSMNIELHPE